LVPGGPLTFAAQDIAWRDKFSYGMQGRKYAIRLHRLVRSFDGGRADIQVPESDFSHDFVVRHERDLAGVNPRDSRLCAGHGNGECLVWAGSELDSRGYAAATLIGAVRLFAVLHHPTW